MMFNGIKDWGGFYAALRSSYVGFGCKKTNNIFQKCFVCGRRGKNRNKAWVLRHGEYLCDGAEFYFHLDCIENVLGHPEKYETMILDSALKVDELISHIESTKKEGLREKEQQYLDLLKKAKERRGNKRKK